MTLTGSYPSAYVPLNWQRTHADFVRCFPKKDSESVSCHALPRSWAPQISSVEDCWTTKHRSLLCIHFSPSNTVFRFLAPKIAQTQRRRTLEAMICEMCKVSSWACPTWVPRMWMVMVMLPVPCCPMTGTSPKGWKTGWWHLIPLNVLKND